jgi:sugar phosphate isomerase/epimerase
MFSTLAPNVLPLRVPFKRQLDLAQANGFEALDLPMGHLLTMLHSSGLDEIKESFSSHGLRCGGWQLPFSQEGDDVEFSSGLKRLPRAAELAGALGSPWCFAWIEPFSDQLTFAANTARYIERMRLIADVLGENNCSIGLEVIGPETLLVGRPHPFVHTIPAALELLVAIDRPNVGLLLDSFHWYTSRSSVAELKALSASEVFYVHINDAIPGIGIDQQLDQVRLLPGASGVIDLVGFLKVLDEIGYGGPVAVEPFSADLATIPPAERVRLAGESLHAAFAAADLRIGHNAAKNGRSTSPAPMTARL